MKIILLKDVSKLGKEGEVKEVAEGYGRNFLLPNNLAVLADAKALAVAEIKMKAKNRREQGEKDRFVAIKNKIANREVKVEGKISQGGKLFAAVKPSEISSALKQQLGAEVGPDFIIIKKPIKEAGEHSVEIKFTPEIFFNIKIRITGTK
ncbi:MAG: 50S ribosomal protein L9 [Patescibacteria group bacterium]|nr:50S ribosomal protein L9 [Patescibacteria group bacterium]MDD5490709.1 50S ribosomal protein L9 [Patescibacteria group bacterium]